MIIDTHVHFFHDKIAAATLNELKGYANFEPVTEGNLASSIAYADKNGIDKFFALNIATKPKNNTRVNDFAIANNSERVVSFGSVNPFFDGYEEELDRLKENKIIGIKFHPQYQHFDLGDKSFYPIYKAAEKRGLYMYFHMGFDPYIPDSDFAAPLKLANIAKEVNPDFLIAAHFGGYKVWDEVEKYLAKSGVYLDTAVLYDGGNDMDLFKRILDKTGIDKILFATDTPWSHFSDTVKFVEKLGLSDAEKEKVYFKNALKILGE